MIGVEELVTAFHVKLERTKSLDAALVKALWLAYKRGYAEGVAAARDGNVEKQQETENG